MTIVVAIQVRLFMPVFILCRSLEKEGISHVSGKDELSEYVGKWVQVDYDYAIDVQLSATDFILEIHQYGLLNLNERSEYVFASTDDLFYSVMKGKNYILSLDDIGQCDKDSNYSVVGYVTSLSEFDLKSIKGQLFSLRKKKHFPDDESINYAVAVRICKPELEKKKQNKYMGYLCVEILLWGIAVILSVKNVRSLILFKKGMHNGEY